VDIINKRSHNDIDQNNVEMLSPMTFFYIF